MSPKRLHRTPRWDREILWPRIARITLDEQMFYPCNPCHPWLSSRSQSGCYERRAVSRRLGIIMRTLRHMIYDLGGSAGGCDKAGGRGCW